MQKKQRQSKEDNACSQFTRGKLDGQYNPKVRFFKSNLMSFTNLPEKERHEFQAKEEHQICNKMMKQLRNGSHFVLDWNTKTNFRVTKSILPRLKTEPSESIFPNKLNKQFSPSSQSLIDKKRQELAKLLHRKHKKKYMQTKSEQQQQKRWFGNDQSMTVFKNYSFRKPKKNDQLSLSKSNKSYEDGQEPKIEEVQQNIINNSKLQILKEELKNKFKEIRQFYYQGSKKNKFIR